MAKRKDTITVGRWAIEWFHRHAEGQLARNTENGYRNLIFRHIAAGLGDISLDRLTEKQVRAFYDSLYDAGLSRRSVWCVHLLLRRVLDEAGREQLISTNPSANIEVPKADTRQSVHLRLGQIKRYLAAAKALEDYPIVYVGLTSGLRQGELISLPWAAFDAPGRRLLLQKRWVSLTEQAAKELAQAHSRYPDSPNAFLDPKTSAPYTPHRLYYLHRQLLRQAKLPVISFRDLQMNAKEMEL